MRIKSKHNLPSIVSKCDCHAEWGTWSRIEVTISTKFIKKNANVGSKTNITGFVQKTRGLINLRTRKKLHLWSQKHKFLNLSTKHEFRQIVRIQKKGPFGTETKKLRNVSDQLFRPIQSAPDWETGPKILVAISLMADQQWVKTIHNVCGLACILGLTWQVPTIKSPSLPRNIAPKEWCPPTRVRKSPNYPGFLVWHSSSG